MKVLMSVVYFIKSKWVAFAVLLAAVILYGMIPSGTPFVELAYTAVTVLAIVTLAPVLRLLVFNEVAVYAEGGQMVKDLESRSFTPALVHYWFATAICYIAPILCIASIHK